MKVLLHYAKMQFFRVMRDPLTVGVLFGIPVLLLLLFGLFMGRDNSDVSLRVAIVNNSSEQFAEEFAGQLKNIDVLAIDNDATSSDDAAAKLRDGALDGVIELPPEFGAVQDERPSGTVNISASARDQTSGDILSSVITSVAERNNAAIMGGAAPIQVERTTIEGGARRAIDTLFPMFTAMGIMMVGIFGIGSGIPSDKKMGILRRMRVTPLTNGQFLGGMTLAFTGIVLVMVALMTVIAMTVFNMEMQGDWLSFGALVLLGSLLMLAIGVFIGGVAKNSTQADIYGQIVFIVSLMFSGLWVPKALMPDWLREIVAYLPLSPIMDGMERIVVEGASIVSLGFQVAVIVGWLAIVTILSIKTFRWE